MTPLLLALLALALTASPARAGGEQVHTIAGRAGVTQSFVLIRPEGPSVTRESRTMRESLGDVALEAIRVPVLVVHHRDDRCPASPYADSAWLMRRLSGAPRRELLTYTGGDAPQSGPCEPLSPHGYFGLDAKVVDALAIRMVAAPADAKP